MTYLLHTEDLLENNAEIFSGLIITQMKKTGGKDEVKVLQLKNITDTGEVELDELDSIMYYLGKINEKYFLREDDIIIKAKSSNYKAGIIKNLPKENFYLIPSSQLIVVRLKEKVKENKILPDFLWLFLNSKKGKKIISEKTYGSIVRFVKTDTLKEIVLSYPSIGTQEEIVKVYKKMMERKKLAQKLLSLYEEEMETFFEIAFEGEIK